MERPGDIVHTPKIDQTRKNLKDVSVQLNADLTSIVDNVAIYTLIQAQADIKTIAQGQKTMLALVKKALT